jgi:hypothetical protein
MFVDAAGRSQSGSVVQSFQNSRTVTPTRVFVSRIFRA